ncbi:Uncharacterised protein [uncultured archaeon]|nr:Uncharacterised protein [uncultured archaeon]
MVKKGFWVVILLLLVVNVSAVEFQWKLTQYKTVDRSGPHCDVVSPSDPTAEVFRLSSSDCKIQAQGIFDIYGPTEYHLQVGIAIFIGDQIVAADWYKSSSGEGTFVKTDLKEGKGDKVALCSQCLRWTTVHQSKRYCDNYATAHIYVPIENLKSNVTLAEGKKIIGKASDFAKRCYVTEGIYTPESANPGVYMYTDDQENIIACIDSDKNKRCDIEQASTCTTGDWNAKWYTSAKGNFAGDYCCGEDPSYTPTASCAFYSDLNAICGKDTTGDWKWVASAVDGQSRKLACPTDISFLAGGKSRIFACGNKAATVLANNAFESFALKDGVYKAEAGKHEFLCLQNNATIYECAGDEGTLSDGNNYKESGEWIKDESNNIQFCSPDKNSWVTDLDQNKGACIAASNKQTWPVGQNWFVAWTGTKCCGDPLDDNTPEGTYEDPWQGGEGKAGGCYNNTFIASGEFADAAETIINYKGKFYSCEQSKTLSTITTTAQPTCGAPLLDATLLGTKHHIVCTPEGKWMFTNNTAATQPTSTMWSTSQGCCLGTQCWNGTSCREIGQYDTIEDRGYRCTAD